MIEPGISLRPIAYKLFKIAEALLEKEILTSDEIYSSNWGQTKGAKG